MIKKLIPSFLKRPIRLLYGRLRDLLTGTRFKLARYSQKKIEEGRSFKNRISITQPINVSEWAENKKYNLRLAISRFQDLPISPGEIFSFWHFIGNPSKKAGYKVGINIIKGKLDFEYGGGLCQLSGLMYHLALSAGLEIVERYPHSVDLYTDETRYTPLGADATTAYGYKDLRLKNTLDTPVCFRIRIDGETLTGVLCAPEEIEIYELKFNKKIVDDLEIVETLQCTNENDYKLLCTQSYVISDHNETI